MNEIDAIMLERAKMEKKIQWHKKYLNSEKDTIGELIMADHDCGNNSAGGFATLFREGYSNPVPREGEINFIKFNTDLSDEEIKNIYLNAKPWEYLSDVMMNNLPIYTIALDVNDANDPNMMPTVWLGIVDLDITNGLAVSGDNFAIIDLIGMLMAETQGGIDETDIFLYVTPGLGSMDDAPFSGWNPKFLQNNGTIEFDSPKYLYPYLIINSEGEIMEIGQANELLVDFVNCGKQDPIEEKLSGVYTAEQIKINSFDKIDVLNDYVLSKKVIPEKIIVDTNALLKTSSYAINSPYIAEYAYQKLPYLKEVIFTPTTETLINDKINPIGQYAFDGCNNLETVRFANTQYIGKNAFPKISEFYFEDPTIDNWLKIEFEDETANPLSIVPSLKYSDGNGDYIELVNLTITNEEIEKINSYAFYGYDKLTDVIFTDSITEIGDYAFCKCSNLVFNNLPNNLNTLGKHSLYNTKSNITELDLTSYSHIGKGSLTGWDNIEKLILPWAGDGIVSDIFYVGFYPGIIGGKQGSILIESYLVADMFQYDNADRAIFENNDKLTPIIQEYVYQITGGSAVGRSTCYIPKSLKEIKIKNNDFIYLASHTFSNMNTLEKIDLGETNLGYIGNEAFYGCTNLKEIIIPANFTTIYTCMDARRKTNRTNAISNCDNLTTITLNGTSPFMTVYNGALYTRNSTGGSYKLNWYPLGLQNEILDDFASTSEIAPCTFAGNKHLKKIILPSGITTIPTYCFVNSNIEEVVMPSGITSIGEQSFGWMENLKNINIPESVNSIATYAFYSCNSLTNVVIPANVTSIGNYAFANCSNLTIYCEASSQPSGWVKNWKSSNTPVYWAGQWEYVDGVPTPII